MEFKVHTKSWDLLLSLLRKHTPTSCYRSSVGFNIQHTSMQLNPINRSNNEERDNTQCFFLSCWRFFVDSWKLIHDKGNWTTLPRIIFTASILLHLLPWHVLLNYNTEILKRKPSHGRRVSSTLRSFNDGYRPQVTFLSLEIPTRSNFKTDKGPTPQQHKLPHMRRLWEIPKRQMKLTTRKVSCPLWLANISPCSPTCMSTKCFYQMECYSNKYSNIRIFESSNIRKFGGSQKFENSEIRKFGDA